MTILRKLAYGVAGVAARYASPENREWAEGMLRELDFIEDDWEALRWALGSTTAICGRSGLRIRRTKEEGMNDLGRKAVGLVEGVGIAAGVLAVAFGLIWMGFRFFPSLGLEKAEWTHLVVMILIPEGIFVAAVVALWRKRRPMAVGILLSGAVLATHVVLHLATHGLPR